jgi:hypothetical protein
MMGSTIGTDGVIGADGADAGLGPTLLVATTVKVYAVPLVNPVTLTDVAPVVDPVAPPGDAVTA